MLGKGIGALETDVKSIDNKKEEVEANYKSVSEKHATAKSKLEAIVH